MIGGDFNVVLNDVKKIGGIPILPQHVEDFAFCVNSCALEEIIFKGSLFTWWNGRARDDIIFERLDRMFINAPLQDWFSSLEVEHLAKTGSNHNWLVWEHEDPFISFKCKMKKLEGAFSQWSRFPYGDIFKQIIIREEITRIREGLFEEDPSSIDRYVLQKAQAEMKKYLHYEEEFWRQKSDLDWFVEGDRKTKFIHTIVKERRKKQQIRKIQNLEGDWIEEADQIVAEAISFYEKQFT
ncbi:uncharacterized protein LOC132639628 [Lycium barbarum]|uniref:uncharacterized protein LOC132639628 n=1 Tax=Lycium barbarum TaxID=112863 RepID=UPI00293EBF69|nr:uncharacterized protein LOC132639628 [Lycium barbarum]